MTEDPLAVPYRERERSVTMAPLGDEEPHEELLTLNMGPHHPATHGVLRLLTTLEGEVVRDVKPIIGYLHTGIEKSCEDQQYWKVITFVERMDYLAYYYNATAYCMAVEKLLEIEVPPRAQYLRVAHMELNRDRLSLVRAGHRRTRPWRRDDALVGLPRPRPRARSVRDVVRPAHASALHPDRRRLRGHPARLGGEGPRVPEDHAGSPRPVRGPARSQRDLAGATQGHRGDLPGAGARARRDRAPAARHRPPVGPAQGDAVLVLRAVRLQGAGRPPRRQLRPLQGAHGRDARVAQDRRAGARRAARGAVHHRRPQGCAAAPPRARHLDGGAHPSLQARHGGLPGAARRDLRGDRVAARRAGLLRAGRRLGQAGTRAHARPELREPPEPARDGAATR